MPEKMEIQSFLNSLNQRVVRLETEQIKIKEMILKLKQEGY